MVFYCTLRFIVHLRDFSQLPYSIGTSSTSLTTPLSGLNPDGNLSLLSCWHPVMFTHQFPTKSERLCEALPTPRSASLHQDCVPIDFSCLGSVVTKYDLLSFIFFIISFSYNPLTIPSSTQNTVFSCGLEGLNLKKVNAQTKAWVMKSSQLAKIWVEST